MSALIGLDAQAETLLSAAASGRMHHGWIFAGPKGVGKASLARAVATRLLAEAADPMLAEPDMFGGGPSDPLSVPSDHQVARLMEAESHPDFVLLKRLPKDDKKKDEDRDEADESQLKRNISIEQVRGLHRSLATRPSMSDRRIVMIDAADDLERSGANALLKNLEEPPAGTLFFLISHAPGRLLPTIRSRCRVLPFTGLSDEDVRAAVRRQLPEGDPGEIDAMVRAGAGSPGRALGFAGLGIDKIDADLNAIAAGEDAGNARRLALAKSLALKSARPRYEAFLDRAPAFIAAASHKRRGTALAEAISAWEQASQLASGAIILNLDPAATVFELCSQVARLSVQSEAA